MPRVENKLDVAYLAVKGGKGGDGMVHFRREKYVPRGGPDGGDGGKGGDVYVVGDKGLRTLAHLMDKRFLKADDGKPGGPKKMKGAAGKDLYIKVPLGTVVYDADTGEKIGEVLRHGQKILVARGGKGGRGNVHFKSPTNRAPQIAEPGEEGEFRRIKLELKTIADIGIVGFPNAGKSTLLNTLTGAKSKVADYEFTTLNPYLGVLKDEFGLHHLVLVDIPGLIEGASEGRGLGHEFLRHVQRAKALVFVLDPTRGDVKEQYYKLLEEMERFDPDILNKKRIIVINKIDAYDGELPDEIDGIRTIKVSALLGVGLDELMKALFELFSQLREEEKSDK